MASPVTDASISSDRVWEPVHGMNVSVSLASPASVLVTYSLPVGADKPHLPGGDFLNTPGLPSSGLGDFLGSRLVVNGQAYRQSGSHVSPLSSLERTARQLRGMLTLHLPAGEHTVIVQWKRWGNWVRSWYSRPSLSDGFAQGRAVTVGAIYLTLQLSSPLSQAVAARDDEWQDIRGVSVAFSYDPDDPLEPKVAGKS